MSTDKSFHPDSHRSIMRSTSVIAAGTLTSRVLGFIRDILLAKILGTGFQADALFVAFRIPNMFRDMVGEGATNSAVVPVLSEYKVTKGREDFWRFVSILLVFALVTLSVLTILGILLAPFIVRLLAPGFIAEPEKLALTIRLTKILFPYLIFIGLTAYSMAILYTYRSFAAPAFSPCILNVAIIVSALVSSSYLKEPVFGLALGILIGGLFQLMVQLPPLWKNGVHLQRPSGLRHPGVIKVGRLLLPRLVGAGVYQLTVFVDTFCASLASIVGAGGIAAIYYANRLVQFPMGVFGFALASAVLPSLSSLAASGDTEKLKRTIVFALENILFVMFPASVMMILLATPIIRILFERGQFGTYSTMITSSALMFYAIGLYGFGGVKILVTAFHARQDTKTPVKVAAVCLIINGSLNFILMGPMKIGGIALASSIAASINFFWLYRRLERQVGNLDSAFTQFIPRVLSASLVMGIVVHWGWSHLRVGNEIVTLVLIGLAGIVVYGMVCYALKVEQARKVYLWITARGRTS